MAQQRLVDIAARAAARIARRVQTMADRYDLKGKK